MAVMQVTVTRSFSAATARELTVALREHAPVDEARFQVRKSEGQLPEFVQLIADWRLWTGFLGAGAALFLKEFAKQLGKDAGADAWRAVRAWLGRAEAKPLADIATALAKARAAGAGHAHIAVAIGETYRETVLVIRDPEPEKIAAALARFVAAAEALATAMEKQAAAGHAPTGPALITVQDDGSLTIEWVTARDLERRTLTLRP